MTSTVSSPSTSGSPASAPSANLAIASTATVAAVGEALSPGTNRSVVIEFRVADVDAAFAALAPAGEDVVLEPSTMPWGNRSALVRDPDGNVVNLFSTPETVAR